MVYPKPTTFVEKIERAAGNVPLPGLSAIDVAARSSYQRVFFGAQRDWPNDEVGWTRVPHTKTIYKIDRETNERKKLVVKCNRRDINYAERRRAGWNLLQMDI